MLIHVSTDICFASAKSSISRFPHNNSLPEIKSACFEKEGMRCGVEGSTLHYITAHKYLTVGIICKYFIKPRISSSPVPQGPLLGRFTSHNTHLLKKKKEFHFSFEKNLRRGRELIGAHKQQNSGGFMTV